METINLDVTEEQARIIARALFSYSALDVPKEERETALIIEELINDELRARGAKTTLYSPRTESVRKA